jgi:hypothetical protein
VYIFTLGLAIYESNYTYQTIYNNFYKLKDKHEAACHYLKYWGQASLFHDIGYPFEIPFEQVASYFEVAGDERKKRPFVSYRNLESYIKIDKVVQRKIRKLYNLDTNKILTNTNELFAYALSEKLSDEYYFSEQEMLHYLQRKPVEPNEFNHYMDHAYFSATVLFRKLFCELQMDLTEGYMDALTAIILHNSLYKFSVAFYKEAGNIPFKAELHPLAYMLMLCDEVQCWDRIAYGRNSKRELHPMGCRFEFSNDTIKATYIYDENEKKKIERFKNEYKEWKKADEEKRGKKPKLKAYSGMFLKDENGVSDFLGDIQKIVDLTEIKLEVETELGSRENSSGRYLSDSNFLNLYHFALVLHGRWGRMDAWNRAKKKGEEEKFLSNEKRIKEFEDEFDKLSLEYKLSNINQAKAFAKYMNEIGCFYTDKPVEFDLVTEFSGIELQKIGPLEHQRWLQEHIDMGWDFVEKSELEEIAKGNVKKNTGLTDEASEEFNKEFKKELEKEREQRRQHWDMIQNYDFTKPEVSSEQVKENYKRLAQEEKDKDTAPMECMLAMLKVFDGIRIYRLY